MDRFRLEITPLKRELQTPAPPGGVLTSLIGEYETIFKGSGLEFEDFREYAPGDPSKRIDWKASLKSNKILIKEFKEERNSEVIFCLDVSSGMIFGSKKLKAQYGAEFIASLGKQISDAGNSIGLITFTNKVNKFIRPDTGNRQVNLFMDILSSYSTYGGRNNFKRLLHFLEGGILKGTTLIVVSDFFNLRRNKRTSKVLRVLKGKYQLVFVIVRDPVEEFFTHNQKQVLLMDPRTKRNILISTSKIKKRYIEATRLEKVKLKKFLKDLHIPILELYTNIGFVEPLHEFFARWENNS